MPPRPCLLFLSVLLLMGCVVPACEDNPPAAAGKMEPMRPKDRVYDKQALAQVQLPSWPPLGSEGLALDALPGAYRRGMALLEADPHNLAFAEEAQKQATRLGKTPREQALRHVLAARLQLALGHKSNGQILEGNLQAARRELDRALELAPDCYEALFFKADRELAAGRRANYDALVKRAKALRPDSPETRWLQLRQASKQTDFQKWMQLADQLIRDARHPALLRQAYAYVSQRLLSLDRKARAMGLQKAMLKRLRDDPQAIRLHIEFLIQQHLPDEALTLSEHLLRLQPGPGQLKLKADALSAKGAVVLARSSDPDEAEPWFRQALEVDPENAQAWLGLAMALNLRAAESESDSDLARALKAAGKAKQLDPSNRSARTLYEGLYNARHR